MVSADTFQPIAILTTNGAESAVLDFELPLNSSGLCEYDFEAQVEGDVFAKNLGAKRIAQVARGDGNTGIIQSPAVILDDTKPLLFLASTGVTASGANVRAIVNGVAGVDIVWVIFGQIRLMFPENPGFTNRPDFRVTKMKQDDAYRDFLLSTYEGSVEGFEQLLPVSLRRDAKI